MVEPTPHAPVRLRLAGREEPPRPARAAPRLARALAVLGVEPSEARSVGLMTAHSFFTGCATVFFETAASAAFLARFPGSSLPWVYLAAAAVNTLTGAGYAWLQRRASFARMMTGTLWFLLALESTVRVGLAASHAAWLAFAALVAYRVVSSLTDLEYWAVASRLYDVQQARRLFGLIGTGEVVARIAGAFAVPLLVPRIGVSNLMVLSAGGLVLCLVTLAAVLRRARSPAATAARAEGGGGDAAARRGEGTHGAAAGLRALRAEPYIALVVGVAVLATFGKYFVDFAYLEQLGARGHDEARLAGFLGLFNGLAQTLSLLARLFVSRPLLSRFGVRGGVLVLPVLHGLCAAVALGCGALGVGGGAALFWCALANQGIYKALKHPIDNASFKVLYQPLRAEQRLAAQIAVEVIFSPVVVGAAGCVMLLFSQGRGHGPAAFSLVLLATFVAWTIAARAAGRAYGRQLVAALARRGTDASTVAAARAGDVATRDASSEALVERLATADAATRDALLAELDRRGFGLARRDPRRAAVLALLRAEARAADATRAALREHDGAGPRRAALRDELAGARQRALRLLAMLHEQRDAVRRAAAHVAHAAGETRALAREVLELALPADLRRAVLPLLLDADAPAARAAGERRESQPGRSAGDAARGDRPGARQLVAREQAAAAPDLPRDERALGFARAKGPRGAA